MFRGEFTRIYVLEMCIAYHMNATLNRINRIDSTQKFNYSHNHHAFKSALQEKWLECFFFENLQKVCVCCVVLRVINSLTLSQC